MAVWNAAGAEIARDAEFPLFADFGALASELFGVARVIELAIFLEARHDDLDEQLIVGAAAELLFHFMDRVCAAHEGAESNVVELGFGFELAGAGEHGKSIEEKVARGQWRGKARKRLNTEGT